MFTCDNTFNIKFQHKLLNAITELKFIDIYGLASRIIKACTTKGLENNTSKGSFSFVPLSI